MIPVNIINTSPRITKAERFRLPTLTEIDGFQVGYGNKVKHRQDVGLKHTFYTLAFRHFHQHTHSNV